MSDLWVHIKWKDASLATGYHKKRAKVIGLSKMETVGILVEEKPDHIRVALTSTETEDEYGEILSIPKAGISSMKILHQGKTYYFLLVSDEEKSNE